MDQPTIEPERPTPSNNKRPRVDEGRMEEGGADVDGIPDDWYRNIPMASSRMITAGDAGVPGVIQYPEWKPPDPATARHTKTFYLELENDNFALKDVNKQVNELELPYYMFMHQYIPWYLSTAEFNWYLKCTNFSRIKNVRFQINVVGVRLPFTTNNESSSIANSQVDQQLDVFRGLEKLFPFRVHDHFNDTSINHPAHLQAVFTRLYGKHLVDETNHEADIPATQGYRRWHIQPTVNIYQNNQTLRTTAHTFPSFAECKYMTADLRSFRGPLIDIAYKTKNGIIGYAKSASNTVPFDTNTGECTLWKTKPLYSSFDNNPTVQGGPSIAPSNNHDNIPVFNYNLGWFTYTSQTMIHDDTRVKTLRPARDQQGGNTSCYGYLQTVEGMAASQRSEVELHNFQSVMLGVRPQMNGSDYQRGILQLEIKTECDVEYQVYWPNPAPMTNDLGSIVNTNKFGLTNDLDRFMQYPLWQLPAYFTGSKQPYRPANYVA